MYYTVTFNPAIDLVMDVPQFQIGALNRSHTENYVVGGKGINISLLLKNIDIDSITLGFLGGFTGEYIKSYLENQEIQTDFISINNLTRINIKLHSEQETEINSQGPEIDADAIEKFKHYLSSNLVKGDTIFLSGNAAPGINETFYQWIAKLCMNKEARFILDTNKELLTDCLEYHPFFIKPNEYELEEIFSQQINSIDDIFRAASALQDKGARNVLVSRGGNGSVLLTEDGDVFQVDAPKGKVINSAGAGDSMVAGFIACFDKTHDYAESLKFATASGSATAFSMGIATQKDIETLLPQITINKI